MLFVLLSLLDDIIMLENSSIHQIPFHLQRILSDRKNFSSIDVLNVLVYYVALECGFISKRLDASSYIYTWFYSYDKRVFEDLQWEHFSRKMSLKFVMNPSYEFSLECHELGDITLITMYEVNDSNVSQCESIALPVSRYVPFKKLLNPLSSSFRNLKELSLKLKHDIFHPLRNQIYDRSRAPGPYLNGMDTLFMTHIYKLLNAQSKHNLAQTCKTQYINLLNFKKLRN